VNASTLPEYAEAKDGVRTASGVGRGSHSDVGCRVTSNHNSCRRPTHISIAAIACALFRKNVFQVCDDGAPPQTRYFETVD